MKRNLDIGVVGGLGLGIVAIFGSFLMEGGSIAALILIPAMVIVFGGTIAAATVGGGLNAMINLPKYTLIAFVPPTFDTVTTIDVIVHYSTVARKDGILSLEREIHNVPDPFLRKMLRFAIDGTDPETIRSIAEIELHYIAERHMANAGIFTKMGGYAPTMGIIGTVLGLVSTLANAGGDPNDLIHHIATAFIATLWGIFTANIIYLPLADKLKAAHAAETLNNEMMLEGVLAIQAGEIPSIIKAKLCSMLPSKLLKGQEE